MSFEKLIRPDSVAIVGASAHPTKVGHAILKNILSDGYEGDVYPVNPTAQEILGKVCYRSLQDIPGEVDLAVIVVKRDLVASILKDCVSKSVKAVIIITAGFSEADKEGKRLQQEITRIARYGTITMMGPNCVGLINPSHKLNASFGLSIGKPGSVAIISQSGALITAIQDIASSNRIGFSVLASVGNKASLDEVDFLVRLKDEENTRVIAAYLEDIPRGQEFMRVAEGIAKVKPIVILKSGRTETGAQAASSHTGSLAGADSAYESAFRRTGVIRADSVENLFDVSMAFAYQPLPKGNRVAVLTNAGGPGIMMSDALEMAGLKIPKPDKETEAQLSRVLSTVGSVHNPVDLLGDADAELYGKAIAILLGSDSFDSLIVILAPQRMTPCESIAQKVVDISKKYDKPVLTCFMGADAIAKGVAILREEKIPQYPVPERAARVMMEMAIYSQCKSRPLRIAERFAVNKNPVIKIIRAYTSRQKYEIGEVDAKTILKAYNFDVPPGIMASTVEEAVNFADENGYPVAMKISSPDILHKSDMGGVKIGLTSRTEVEDAFELMMIRIKRKMPEAEIRGVLVEKMVNGGREVILGMKRDAQFGPNLLFGLGGIFVEILKDITFSLAPVTAEECRKMIESTKSYKLLTGVRGEKGVDIDAVVLSLQRMSQLVMDFPEIEEIDINPLLAGQKGDGAFVVDARIILSKKGE